MHEAVRVENRGTQDHCPGPPTSVPASVPEDKTACRMGLVGRAFTREFQCHLCPGHQMAGMGEVAGTQPPRPPNPARRVPEPHPLLAHSPMSSSPSLAASAPVGTNQKRSGQVTARGGGQGGCCEDPSGLNAQGGRQLTAGGPQATPLSGRGKCAPDSGRPPSLTHGQQGHGRWAAFLRRRNRRQTGAPDPAAGPQDDPHSVAGPVLTPTDRPAWADGPVPTTFWALLPPLSPVTLAFGVCPRAGLEFSTQACRDRRQQPPQKRTPSSRRPGRSLSFPQTREPRARGRRRARGATAELHARRVQALSQPHSLRNRLRAGRSDTLRKAGRSAPHAHPHKHHRAAPRRHLCSSGGGHTGSCTPSPQPRPPPPRPAGARPPRCWSSPCGRRRGSL